MSINYGETGKSTRTSMALDCMAAAAALCARELVAARNISDSERFIPYGLQLERIPTISDIP